MEPYSCEHSASRRHRKAGWSIAAIGIGALVLGFAVAAQANPVQRPNRISDIHSVEKQSESIAEGRGNVFVECPHGYEVLSAGYRTTESRGGGGFSGSDAVKVHSVIALNKDQRDVDGLRRGSRTTGGASVLFSVDPTKLEAPSNTAGVRVFATCAAVN